MMKKLAYFWSDLRLRFHRTLAEKGWRQLLVPLFLFLLTLCLVTLALWIVYRRYALGSVSYGGDYQPGNVFDAAFYLMFANGGQNLYDGVHWAGLLITSLGVVLVAVLTSVLTNAFDRIGQRYLAGEMTYRMRDHVVIAGVNEVVYSVLKAHRDNAGHYPRFLIMTERDVHAVRRKVLAFMDREIPRDNLVFLFGDITSREDIGRLFLDTAADVFVLGDGNGEEPYPDAVNLDSVKAMGAYLKQHPRPSHLPCHVLFEYQTTFSVFRLSDPDRDIRDVLDFRPLNIYDMWARKVLAEKCLDALPEGGYIGADTPRSVHLVVIGMTRMGVALALQAARLCHFPNFVKNRSRRTRITFIHAQAEREMAYFRGRFPELMRLSKVIWSDVGRAETRVENPDSWLDIEWEFVQGQVEQPQVQAYLQAAAADKSRCVTIAVCLPTPQQSMAAAMYMPDSVYADCLQMLVWHPTSGTLVNELADDGMAGSRYGKLYPFGMLSEGYDSVLEDETEAMMVSYIYGSGQGSAMDWKLEKYHPEAYRNKWLALPVSDRLSSQYNASFIPVKLRSLGCPLDRVEQAMEEQMDEMKVVEHNRWNLEKLLAGYRALTPQELDEIQLLRQTDPKAWHQRRKALKDGPQRAHIDLCPYGEIALRDRADVLETDISLNRAVPYIISCRLQQPLPEEDRPVYTPRPLDLSGIDLPAEYRAVREKIAEDIHETWAQGRLREGWTYGPVRDDARKKHPCLLPYQDLPESEKEYDRRTAEHAIKMFIREGMSAFPSESDK